MNPQKIEIEIGKTTAEADKIQRTRKIMKSLPYKMFTVPIKRIIKQKQDIKKNFQSKKFKKNTKILDYAKKFI